MNVQLEYHMEPNKRLSCNPAFQHSVRLRVHRKPFHSRLPSVHTQNVIRAIAHNEGLLSGLRKRKGLLAQRECGDATAAAHLLTFAVHVGMLEPE